MNTYAESNVEQNSEYDNEDVTDLITSNKTDYSEIRDEIEILEADEINKFDGNYTEIITSNSISNTNSNIYEVSKNNVLFVTSNGSYVITNFEGLATKTNEIIVSSPPQTEQIILLDSSNIQFEETSVESADENR